MKQCECHLITIYDLHNPWPLDLQVCEWHLMTIIMTLIIRKYNIDDTLTCTSFPLYRKSYAFIEKVIQSLTLKRMHYA